MNAGSSLYYATCELLEVNISQTPRVVDVLGELVAGVVKAETDGVRVVEEHRVEEAEAELEAARRALEAEVKPEVGEPRALLVEAVARVRVVQTRAARVLRRKPPSEHAAGRVGAHAGETPAERAVRVRYPTTRPATPPYASLLPLRRVCAAYASPLPPLREHAAVLPRVLAQLAGPLQPVALHQHLVLLARVALEPQVASGGASTDRAQSAMKEYAVEVVGRVAAALPRLGARCVLTGCGVQKTGPEKEPV
ncbi:hypothetical protein FIBSPDRAFT_891228 [Athelia psychrophila]|uniref:Uncharacterized protein n=1 Tax=Athelia psychrophila TaxID=1759441 RepID=A0A166JWT3_9AGAM|nr:hypothetical protein FIBSPDRAFT_891228 [Fibularhizoctonia sp. CBS 109695]